MNYKTLTQVAVPSIDRSTNRLSNQKLNCHNNSNHRSKRLTSMNEPNWIKCWKTSKNRTSERMRIMRLGRHQFTNMRLRKFTSLRRELNTYECILNVSISIYCPVCIKICLFFFRVYFTGWQKNEECHSFRQNCWYEKYQFSTIAEKSNKSIETTNEYWWRIQNWHRWSIRSQDLAISRYVSVSDTSMWSSFQCTTWSGRTFSYCACRRCTLVYTMQPYSSIFGSIQGTDSTFRKITPARQAVYQLEAQIGEDIIFSSLIWP